MEQTLEEAQADSRQINAAGSGRGSGRQGIPQWTGAEGPPQRRGAELHPGAGARTAQLAGEDKAVEQKRTYENRRRVRTGRGKRLQKWRSELTERSFAHLYETGGMRRVHLRGRNNILKRLLVHGAGFNLSLILRKTLGVGKPRRLQGLLLSWLCGGFVRAFKALSSRVRRIESTLRRKVDSWVGACLRSSWLLKSDYCRAAS